MTDEPAVPEPTVRDRARGRRFLVGAATASVLLPLVLGLVPLMPAWELGGLVLGGGLLSLSDRGRRLVRLGAGSAALVTLVVLFTPAMPWAVHWLDVSTRPRRADVIVVLGGGIQCGTGDLDATSVARTARAVALLRSGVAPEVTISDNDRSDGRACPSQARVTRDFVRSIGGFAGARVTQLPAQRSTRSEAETIARLAPRRAWRRIIVVTSPTHSRRARRVFRDAGLRVSVVASAEPNFDLEFEDPTDHLRALAPVARELAGLLRLSLSS